MALVLELFSRKFVGSAMSDSMAQDLTLEALHMALGWRDPPTGLTHHLDRGSQYAAGDYRKVLAARGITVSTGDKVELTPLAGQNETSEPLSVADTRKSRSREAR